MRLCDAPDLPHDRGAGPGHSTSEMIQEDMKILEPRTMVHRDHGEKNTEKRNTTEENEINVRQLTQGIKRSGIGMDASDGPTWNSLRDLCG